MKASGPVVTLAGAANSNVDEPISIVEYNVEWPRQYQAELHRVRQLSALPPSRHECLERRQRPFLDLASPVTDTSSSCLVLCQPKPLDVQRNVLYPYVEWENGGGRQLWFFLLWGQVNIGARVDPAEVKPPAAAT